MRSLACPPVRNGPGETLSKSDILSVVKASMPAIDRCAELHSTEVILKATSSIDTRSRVKDAKIVDPRWADDPMGVCVLKVLRGMRYPEHLKPVPPITFPFRMR